MPLVPASVFGAVDFQAQSRNARPRGRAGGTSGRIDLVLIQISARDNRARIVAVDQVGIDARVGRLSRPGLQR